MSDIAPPEIIGNDPASTEPFDPETGTTTPVPDTPDETITAALQTFKEGMCTTALGAYQLGRSSIPYVKQGTLWGCKKSFQLAKTAFPYIKSGLAKVSSVLANAAPSSQQNNPPESDTNTPDTISTTISNSANCPDPLVSDQARIHQVLAQVCAAFAELLGSNTTSIFPVMNVLVLQTTTEGGWIHLKRLFQLFDD